MLKKYALMISVNLLKVLLSTSTQTVVTFRHRLTLFQFCFVTSHC